MQCKLISYQFVKCLLVRRPLLNRSSVWLSFWTTNYSIREEQTQLWSADNLQTSQLWNFFTFCCFSQFFITNNSTHRMGHCTHSDIQAITYVKEKRIKSSQQVGKTCHFSLLSKENNWREKRKNNHSKLNCADNQRKNRITVCAGCNSHKCRIICQGSLRLCEF